MWGKCLYRGGGHCNGGVCRQSGRACTHREGTAGVGCYRLGWLVCTGSAARTLMSGVTSVTSRVWVCTVIFRKHIVYTGTQTHVIVREIGHTLVARITKYNATTTYNILRSKNRHNMQFKSTNPNPTSPPPRQHTHPQLPRVFWIWMWRQIQNHAE
jgi:hypothetical protein